MAKPNADNEQRVPNYPDGVQEVQEYSLRTREYAIPFNYPNITVSRKFYRGTEFHGVELNPINSLSGSELKSDCADSIVIEEKHPIVGVTVIGSACTPPGYVMIECTPTESFYRSDELRSVMPIRFRIGNLWGMHMRADQWFCWGKAENLEGEANTESLKANAGGRAPYEPMPEEMLRQQHRWAPLGTVKGHYRELPLSGMSCAVFEVPQSTKVKVMGGCESMAWTEDNYPEDNHYSFRIIRTTVAAEVT